MAERKAYFAGAGVGSLAGALFLIRDANFKGENITIYEPLKVNGGSCDGIGTPEGGYMMRGGRMLNIPTYECLQDLMKSVPSLEEKEKTVYDEFIEFNNSFVTDGKARLVDKNRKVLNVSGMSFTDKHRIQFLRLILTPEGWLGDQRISDYFPDDFFRTNFWYMWSTTFAFQTWHSLAEFRRYCIRFLHEFIRIQNLQGVNRTKYNQYDSIVRPIEVFLRETHGVKFVQGAEVTDVEVEVKENEKKEKTFTAKSITVKTDDGEQVIKVNADDVVIVQNGSMTDAAVLGTMTEPVNMNLEPTSFKVWEKLAEIDPVAFGNPKPFLRSQAESLWYSFSVTINNNPKFLEREIEWSGNEPGTGALVTFKDSNWLMSIVVPKQPHFPNQPENCHVFWGYGLFPDRVGNFVNKKMIDCTGADILQELIGHLRFDQDVLEGAICRTCAMPYITSMFMTRSKGDRPLPCPKGSTNLGFTSQFVEIPGDVVFTVEYSVRAAQMAVYQICNIKKPIPKVHHYELNPIIQAKAVAKSYRDSPQGTLFSILATAGAAVGVAYAVKKLIPIVKASLKK
ncbi:myosin-cross-reactive antigen [Tritrichomonas foetus]|uniref:Myosin-cross-reactive antigen n=1 Tax=Tritrichomonas foetus TaxID=1144522 RepID=A0A1J4JP48_9EUKA|nr:myosin-cross-reactive antigen [Tritrichomonas foetus]|eukprot:OHS99044.1 myosin-cross-reactive antigen [Tritrichomonas foetus]